MGACLAGAVQTEAVNKHQNQLCDETLKLRLREFEASSSEHGLEVFLQNGFVLLPHALPDHVCDALKGRILADLPEYQRDVGLKREWDIPPGARGE